MTYKCYKCEGKLKQEDNMLYCTDKECYRYGLATILCKQEPKDFVNDFIEEMQEKVKEVKK
jgi:hypothetical protein